MGFLLSNSAGQVFPKASSPPQGHQQKHGKIKLLLYAQRWPATKDTQPKGPQTTPRRLHRPRYRDLQLQKQSELSIAGQMSDQINCLPGECTIGRRSLVFLHRPD